MSIKPMITHTVMCPFGLTHPAPIKVTFTDHMHTAAISFGRDSTFWTWLCHHRYCPETLGIIPSKSIKILARTINQGDGNYHCDFFSYILGRDWFGKNDISQPWILFLFLLLQLPRLEYQLHNQFEGKRILHL
jgi:hypothetical protein